MKNKKGFTLIELLAVIVILSIIMIIAVPKILDVIENSKKSAAISSAKGYVKALSTQNAMSQLDNKYQTYMSGEYNVNELNVKNVKGNKPKDGKIILKNGKVIGGSFLCMDDYTVVYKNNTFSISEEKCENIQKNYESIIMLDVARRYYTVDEIKRFIDILSVNENSTIQVHFTDDENVGIESTYLDQTKENATYDNGIYTNPVTGKNFLSFEQVKTIIDYANEKNVRFIPEIDVPAHMNGFFTLAINKFGESYVRNPYDWDDPSKSGIAPGTGDESGNIDLMAPNAKIFIENIYNEYTTFFKSEGCKYFHIGFDEYTYRPELKKDYINELYSYLNKKGFKVRMWSDALTKANISEINNNIEVMYWSYRSGDEYATVPDLQKLGFKMIIANPYYLFFVPSSASTTQESLNYTINNINNNWTLDKWKYTYDSTLDTRENILGAMISVWGEDSSNISSDVIINQTKNMYSTMYSKLKY